MKKITTKQLTISALLLALLIIFATTPFGSIPIGPLVISLQVIPVAIAAVTFGPIGGLLAGTVFGILSCLQAFGIGIPSAMGIALVSINPFLAIIQRLIPRMLEGLLAGLIFNALKKKNLRIALPVAGFATAFFNTLFFMTSLVLLFGNTDYMQNAIAGRSVITYIMATVGINAVVELFACTIATSAIGIALFKAGLITTKDSDLNTEN